jgi:hypothetical protein
MFRKDVFFTDFHIIRPPYESSQQQSFDWLVAAHTKAESVKRRESLNSPELETFKSSLDALLNQVGCKPGVIEKRGHSIPDFLHQKWPEMLIYKLEEDPRGLGLEARSRLHLEYVDQYAKEFYAPQTELPAGYAQMDSGSQTDIIHTELCAFHNNPLLHTPEQLVSQSLFADGCIKYSVYADRTAEKPHLRILGLYEEIIPSTLESMGWHLTDWGFQMILSKHIPKLIKDHLMGYIHHLCQRAAIDADELLQNGLFAIHPGGPKIIQYIQTLLGAEDEQMEFSRRILKNYGNMSSATLPHIWNAICADTTIPSQTKVLSLAFGPGLNIAGAILEKV